MKRKIIKKLDRKKGYFAFSDMFGSALRFCGNLSSFDIDSAAMGDVYYNQDDGRIYVIAIESGVKSLVLLG